MKIELKKVKGLTPIEIVVLTNVINIHNHIETTKEQALTHLNDGKFELAKERLTEANYFKFDKTFLSEMKKQVVEHCSIETLTKIVDNKPFELEYSWTSEQYTIPSVILPRLSSYDKIASNNPKASIYKKLGATITV